jgi:hypothetical protein
MQVLLLADCQSSERILELMADGALNTVFTKKEFDKAKLLRNQNTREKCRCSCKGELWVNHPGEFL